jgi:hypothetical protein
MFSPSWLSFWEIAEGVGAIIVILGVVGEFVAEFTKFLNGNAAKKKFEKVSVLVLILGLVIELLAYSATSHISGVITAKLNKEAGDARKAAGDAIERANKLDLDRVGLEEKIEGLRKENLQLASELQKHMPRLFTEEKKNYAPILLGKYAGTKVAIRWVPQDPETDNFAHLLEDLLTSIGWKVAMDEGWTVKGAGVAISPSQFTDLSAAVTLEVFLNGCNFPAQYFGPHNGKWSDSTNADLLILVGFKGSKVTVSEGAGKM